MREFLATVKADVGPDYESTDPVTLHLVARTDGTIDVHLDDEHERNIVSFVLDPALREGLAVLFTAASIAFPVEQS